MAVQMIRENLAAGFDDLVLAHPGKAETLPGLLTAFDNERRGFIVKLIDMRPEPAMFGFLEDKGESIAEFLMRTEPDELAQPGVDIGFKGVFVFVADAAVQPVSGHHQIVIVSIVRSRAEFGCKPHVYPKFAGAVL